MGIKTRAHQRYRLQDGTIVPGVTTIINQSLGWSKDALIAWARREALAGNDPMKIRDQAADIGTLTHHLIECHIKGTEPDTTEYAPADVDKAETGFLAFLEWEDHFRVEHVRSEIQLVSERHRFGGTIDDIARNNGSLWLLDIKTSKGIYPEHKIQVAAYKRVYEEVSKERIDEVHILQIDKEEGAFHHHRLSEKDVELGWAVFLHCLGLYNLKKEWE
ncbi:MAG: hypothetical protein JXI43_11660 [Tissierellales bacterium]|nr:hypothetical protein [Tissierellales bacterium]